MNIIESLRRLKAVRGRQTDYVRWKRVESFEPDWTRRATFAAAMCSDSKVVCDVGCGTQTLRSFLSEDVIYLPADLNKWSDDTMFCDIARKQLPVEYLSRADTVTMLGVLEYTHDPAWLFAELARYCRTLIVSYCASDLQSRNWRSMLLGRSGKGWLNSFTVGQLVEMLHGARFVLRQMELIDQSQILIKAVRGATVREASSLASVSNAAGNPKALWRIR
jgi:hypothetical protein